MPTSHPVPLAIELQASELHVNGKLTDECGEGHVFRGWLRLLTLLEAARLRSLTLEGHPTERCDPAHRRSSTAASAGETPRNELCVERITEAGCSTPTCTAR
jgi:hypothetical protein